MPDLKNLGQKQSRVKGFGERYGRLVADINLIIDPTPHQIMAACDVGSYVRGGATYIVGSDQEKISRSHLLAR